MDTLFTPWRYAYIAGRESVASGCFLCAAARDPGAVGSLVVHVARHHLVMLNRHPYTNGHLMIAPLDHLADPGEADPQGRAELWPLVLRACAVLRRAYSPDGLNLGLNLGRAAGAGVPDHFHLHVVPRWHGDTNFMSSIAGVRLVPEDLETARQRLGGLFAEEE